jgi:hypothetical protein
MPDDAEILRARVEIELTTHGRDGDESSLRERD